MAFGLKSFKQSQLGRRVGAIIEDPQKVGEMIVFSRHEIPAVEAVGKALETIGPEVRDDYVKTTIGRWVREILGSQGWTPWKSARVAPGNLFSRGMIYKEHNKDNRRGEPARLAPAIAHPDPDAARAAIRRIRERAEKAKRGITLEEALAWRDEGRR
jgi:hypothetical protein